jgi:hypothetical protein
MIKAVGNRITGEYLYIREKRWPLPEISSRNIPGG